MNEAACGAVDGRPSPVHVPHVQRRGACEKACVAHVSTYMIVVRVLGVAAPAETGDVVRLLYVVRRIHHVC